MIPALVILVLLTGLVLLDSSEGTGGAR